MALEGADIASSLQGSVLGEEDSRLQPSHQACTHMNWLLCLLVSGLAKRVRLASLICIIKATLARISDRSLS